MVVERMTPVDARNKPPVRGLLGGGTRMPDSPVQRLRGSGTCEREPPAKAELQMTAVSSKQNTSRGQAAAGETVEESGRYRGRSPVVSV